VGFIKATAQRHDYCWLLLYYLPVVAKVETTTSSPRRLQAVVTPRRLQRGWLDDGGGGREVAVSVSRYRKEKKSRNIIRGFQI